MTLPISHTQIEQARALLESRRSLSLIAICRLVGISKSSAYKYLRASIQAHLPRRQHRSAEHVSLAELCNITHRLLQQQPRQLAELQAALGLTYERTTLVMRTLLREGRIVRTREHRRARYLLVAAATTGCRPPSGNGGARTRTVRLLERT